MAECQLFLQGVKQMWNNFYMNSLRFLTKKQNPRSFTVILPTFGFHFVLTEELRHNPYTIELMGLELLV